MNDYNAMTDEQLLESNNCYDKTATEIILRYRKVVEAKASRYAGRLIEKDDLVQEGMLGLLSAIRHYSKEKNASFKTFADRCIENRMKNAAKKAIPHAMMTESIEDSPITQNSDVVGESPESIIISKEEADALAEKLRDNLSSLETEMFRMFLNGYTYEQMAQSKAITPKAVDNALQRARRKLKSIFR